MSVAKSVPGFLPSTHGLHFANRWAPGPTVRLGPLDPRWIGIGDAAAGLCGGMAWLVRERYQAGLPVPPDTIAPRNASPLFRAILRRQVRSLDWLRGPLRFWLAAITPAPSLARRTRAIDVPRIREAIDAGRLPLVGLVRHHGFDPRRLDRDHVVLAYGYVVDLEASASGAAVDPARRSETITLRLYDPNWPDRDDVAVTLSPAGMAQSTGEPLLGLIALG